MYSKMENMKTSLILDDNLFKAAQREAVRTGQAISELISRWARVGKAHLEKEHRRRKKRSFAPVDLGGDARIDLTSRRDWMDQIEE